MLANYFPLDAKSVSRLATKGLPLEKLKSQIDDSIDFSLELWRSQGLDVVKSKGFFLHPKSAKKKITPIKIIYLMVLLLQCLATIRVKQVWVNWR